MFLKYNFFSQQTKGGVLLPEKGQGKILEGTVISVGPGARDKVRILLLFMGFLLHNSTSIFTL